MTYTEDEIALTWRGAKWCAFDESILRSAERYKELLLTHMSNTLFSALLVKCDAERVDYQISRGSAAIIVDGGGLVAGRHKNLPLALLLALDAAGELPEYAP